MAQLDSRLYYNYYDKANDSTPIVVRGRAVQGSNCATAAVTSATASASPRPRRRALRLHEERGRPRSHLPDRRAPEAGGQLHLAQGSTATLRAGAQHHDNRFWIEYRNSMARRALERAAQVPVPAAALGPRPLGHQQQQRADDARSRTISRRTTSPTTTRTWSSSYVDWNPAPLLDIGFGATWRETDYKDLYYGRTDDKRQIYDASIAYGDPDKFRVSAIGNWGKTEFNQAYRNMATGLSPLPGGTQTATTIRLGHEEHPGQLAGRAAGGLGGHRQAALTGRPAGSNTGGGVDFWSGNTTAAGGFTTAARWSTT